MGTAQPVTIDRHNARLVLRHDPADEHPHRYRHLDPTSGVVVASLELDSDLSSAIGADAAVIVHVYGNGVPTA